MKLALFVVPLLVTGHFALPASGAEDDVALQATMVDLDSEVVAVRCQAANRLGRLADRRATPVLLQALTDAEPQVRRQAAKALGAMKDSRSTMALIAALQDTDQNVRFYAAYALGEIKDGRATPALLKRLEDPAWPVRDQAAWALREIGGPQLAEQLVELLVGEQLDTGRASGTAQQEVAEQSAELQQLVWILRHLDRRATIAQLSAALESESAAARQRVVSAVGALHDAQAVPLLLRALSDESPIIRRHSVALLAELRERQVLEQLMNVARQDPDKTVRQAAQIAVESLSRNADLLAYWSFDEGQGAVVSDVTGNGNDGQRIGCPIVPGKIGKALQCGPGQYVELGRPPEIPLGNSPFTVTAWVASSASDGVVVARGGAFCGFSLYVKENVPKFGIHREQDGPGYIAAGLPLQPLRKDLWVHLAGVVKQDRIELYVDGRLVASTKTAGYLPGDSGQGMEIGFDVGNSAAEISDPWVGLIDEVKVFGVALSADEIAAECQN